MTPNVPTFEELGVKGFTSSQWNGFFIARHTPPAIVSKLSDDVKSALRSPENFKCMVDKDFEFIRAALRSGKPKSG